MLCVFFIHTGTDLKVVLTAVMCSVQFNEDLRPAGTDKEDFTFLPIMMVKGSTIITQRLIQWLEVRMTT